MADRWTIHGAEYANCNCAWGCPCQFGALTTHGHCEAMVCGHIEEGHFNDTRLDGLDWALLIGHPGSCLDRRRGRACLLLALVGGPTKDQPLPAVVRCREAATGRSPG
jgi:hypothetical protein